jgi:hypothetical protein
MYYEIILIWRKFQPFKNICSIKTIQKVVGWVWFTGQGLLIPYFKEATNFSGIVGRSQRNKDHDLPPTLNSCHDSLFKKPNQKPKSKQAH